MSHDRSPLNGASVRRSAVSPQRKKREPGTRGKRAASLTPEAVERNPLAKAFSVLQWMTDECQADVGVREIALGTGMPPSTVHRILADLIAVGLVRSAGTSRRYALGPELSSLAWKFTARFPVRELAMPLLESLVQVTNETAFMAVYSRKRHEMIIVASVETSQQLRYVLPLNTWMPMSFGATCLALMAFLPKDEQQSILEELEEETGAERKNLTDAIEATAQAGYSCAVGRRVPGAVGVSAPVFRAPGDVIGSISLTMPASRFKPGDEHKFGPMVRACSSTLSHELGADRPAYVGVVDSELHGVSLTYAEQQDMP